jgi:hypothetical protein
MTARFSLIPRRAGGYLSRLRAIALALRVMRAARYRACASRSAPAVAGRQFLHIFVSPRLQGVLSKKGCSTVYALPCKPAEPFYTLTPVRLRGESD